MTSNPDVPPFTGYVETTLHALRLIHAARQGVIPRITRRLNDAERRTMIKPGAVFVFSVEESGIKRWTDGLLWSPSRIVGNFLVYREINERTSSRGSNKKSYPLDSSRGISGRRGSPDHSLVAFGSSSRLAQSHGSSDPGAFKINGLIKKTITVTIEGSDLHLISYYTSEDIRSGRLKRPTSRPDIMALPMPPHIFRLTNFRVPPKVEIGPDGKPRLVCEGEDLESPTLECKVEEPTYHVSTSSHWTSDSDESELSPRLEGSFSSGNPLYSQHHGIQSPASYSRDNTGERWPAALENLRIVPVDRQFADSWSPSPSPTTHSPHNLPRRRDLGNTLQHHSSSWSAGGNLQPARWKSDSYTNSPPTSVHQLDRARIRSNTLLENSNSALHRREAESIHFNRENHPQRPSWSPRETTSVEKYSRSQSSFPNTSPSLPFGTNGYHRMSNSFGTGWTSNGNDSPVDTTLHSIQTQPVSSYESSYLSSSPEGFSAVEDYGDS
ncbi:hypothetical protein E4T56_gene16065 [Termitomyces sp. T112]|nr:hypothetical protein E4T56_gene16065 [Termitomyces sp. T112]KAH0585570.1 hypothetical protein H2248_008800 [Termitomyces sp. 'cryptogamus']